MRSSLLTPINRSMALGADATSTVDDLIPAILDSVADTAVLVDRRGAVVAVNAAARDLAGLRHEDLIGRTLLELPPDSPFVRAHAEALVVTHEVLLQVMATNEIFDDQDRSVSTDSGEVAQAVRYAPVLVGGEVVGCTMFIRRSDTGGSHLFRSANVGMVHLDHRGRIDEANRAFAALVERSPGDLRSTPFEALLDPDDVERWRAHLAGALEGQRSSVAEVRLRRPGGGDRWGSVGLAWNRAQGERSRGACLVVEDVTERRILAAELERAHARLEHLAMTDHLTGLGNRTAAFAHLDASDEDRSGAVGSGGLAVLFVDLDGFKGINDRLGHARGDELLTIVGRRLPAVLPDSAVAYRLGGDEFLVLWEADMGAPETATGRAEELAGRIVEAVEVPVALVGLRSVLVSASVGVAVRTDRGIDAHALVARADADMYRRKKRGNRALIGV